VRIRRWLLVLPALLPASVFVGCEEDDGGSLTAFSLDAGTGIDVVIPDAASLIDAGAPGDAGDAGDAAPPTSCLIEDAGYDAGVIDPTDECHVCQPAQAATAWSSRGTLTLLSGKADPATEGWSQTAGAPYEVTQGADYVRLATSTAGGATTSGQNLLYRPHTVPVGKAFTIRATLQVESVNNHNQYDSATAIMGAFTPAAGLPAERAQMIYLDTAAIGWADDSSSKPFTNVDSAYHIYVLSVDAAGGATFTADGTAQLTRAGYTTNGTIAIGDQTNDKNYDGVMRVRTVERICP
jgi:hypothetical protein